MQARVAIFNITGSSPDFTVSLGFLIGDRAALSVGDELFDANNKPFRVTDIGVESGTSGARDSVIISDVDGHAASPTQGNGPLWTPTTNYPLSQAPFTDVAPGTRHLIRNRDNMEVIDPNLGGSAGGGMTWANGSITYVDALNGDDATADGTAGAPFATIQAAADFIGAPTDVAHFETPQMIKIAPGEYAGATINMYNFLYVVGEGSVVINGDLTLEHGDLCFKDGVFFMPRFVMTGYVGGDFRNNDNLTFVHNGHVILTSIADPGTVAYHNSSVMMNRLFTQGVQVPRADSVDFLFVQFNVSHVDIEDGYIFFNPLPERTATGITIEADSSILKSTICGRVKLYTINNCRVGDIVYDTTPTVAGNGTGPGHVGGLDSSGYNGGFTDCRFSGSSYILGFNGTYDPSHAPVDVHVDAFSHKRLMAKAPALNNVGLTLDDYAAGVKYDATVSGLTATDAQAAIDELAPSKVVSGATAERPTAPIAGQQFFDTDLGQPIWWDGVNWVDATGTIV